MQKEMRAGFSCAPLWSGWACWRCAFWGLHIQWNMLLCILFMLKTSHCWNKAHKKSFRLTRGFVVLRQMPVELWAPEASHFFQKFGQNASTWVSNVIIRHLHGHDNQQKIDNRLLQLASCLQLNRKLDQGGTACHFKVGTAPVGVRMYHQPKWQCELCWCFFKVMHFICPCTESKNALLRMFFVI